MLPATHLPAHRVGSQRGLQARFRTRRNGHWNLRNARIPARSNRLSTRKSKYGSHTMPRAASTSPAAMDCLPSFIRCATAVRARTISGIQLTVHTHRAAYARRMSSPVSSCILMLAAADAAAAVVVASCRHACGHACMKVRPAARAFRVYLQSSTARYLLMMPNPCPVSLQTCRAQRTSRQYSEANKQFAADGQQGCDGTSS